MAKDEGYWVVRLDAFTFDSKEDAIAFQDALMDAFTAMPEAEGYGSASEIIFEQAE